jgi:ribonuclease VapC
VIIDSSALLAIYFQESDASIFAATIANADEKYMAAPTLLECCLAAVSRKGDTAASAIQSQVREGRIKIIPFDQPAAEIAINAFLRYGKGRKHPAQLNYGDCISYAVSKFEVMPLLFKGDDFRKTDVECAI